MSYRITGLSPAPFQPLFGLPDAVLAQRNIKRFRAGPEDTFPCRIEMRHAAPGETVLLLNHVCQPAATPYHATHAIFVCEGATTPFDRTDEIPHVMRVRLLSLRGYAEDGMMVDADVVDGTQVEGLIERLFANPDVAYIHAHNAKRGCFSGRIDRV